VDTQHQFNFPVQLPFGIAPVELSFASELPKQSLVKVSWRQVGVDR
jgi:hypothetical protein